MGSNKNIAFRRPKPDMALQNDTRRLPNYLVIELIDARSSVVSMPGFTKLLSPKVKTVDFATTACSTSINTDSAFADIEPTWSIVHTAAYVTLSTLHV